ncbi:MAG: hypothetical protein MZU97_10750 [Bacillus subtilis]|nr:hypothetical protein [Bacillus subtilis]
MDKNDLPKAFIKFADKATNKWLEFLAAKVNMLDKEERPRVYKHITERADERLKFFLNELADFYW